MATFLTTSKMDPSLAARIEASVTGRRRGPGQLRWSPRMVSSLRFGAVAAALVLVSWLVINRYHDRQKLSHDRAALLDAVRAESATLRDEDHRFVARAESLLVRFAGPYEGDLVSDELRIPKAIREIVSRPAVYVRGPLGAFSSSVKIAEAALASTKDAFLLCLVEPPGSRAEKVLLGKVRTAYSGGSLVEQRTSNVTRLSDAEVGLPFLEASWAERVRRAPEHDDIARLRRQLKNAPIDAARRAARASVFVIAMDEPDGEGPTELDGERAHGVRIGLVDLASAKILLRIRKRVDPTWISSATRADYASGLDGCALALDVHDSVP